MRWFTASSSEHGQGRYRSELLLARDAMHEALSLLFQLHLEYGHLQWISILLTGGRGTASKL